MVRVIFFHINYFESHLHYGFPLLMIEHFPLILKEAKVLRHCKFLHEIYRFMVYRSKCNVEWFISIYFDSVVVESYMRISLQN